MKSTGELWRRGITQMVVVALAITLVVVIAMRISGAGDDGGGAAPQPSTELPTVGTAYSDEALGVELRLPKGWTTKKGDGTLDLRSDDGKADVSIATSQGADDPAPALDLAIASLKKRYPGAAVTQKIRGERTGGLPSQGAVLEGKSDDGERIRIVVSVATGEKTNYVVQVSSTALASNSVAEAQTVLRYLDLFG